MAPIFIPIVGAAAAVLAVLAVVAKHNLLYHGQRSLSKGAPVTPDDNHNDASTSKTTSSPSFLEQARQLKPPTALLMKGGEYEHDDFWRNHDSILKAAWDEWWHQQRQTATVQGVTSLPNLLEEMTSKTKNTMINPALLEAIETVRRRPTLEHEQAVKDLFQPIQEGGVYQIPTFLTPHGIRLLRQHLDAASYYDTNNSNTTTTPRARIPTRRPNGMNRYGIIIDPQIEGAVTYTELNDFIEHLVDDMVRPLSRMLFPELVGRTENGPAAEDDCEYYAFTIRYHPDEDMELKEHSDASVYTININLNYVDDDDDDEVMVSGNVEEKENPANTEGYEGSSLYFVQEEHGDNGNSQGYNQGYATSDSTVGGKDQSQPTTDNQKIMTNVTFTPGMAVLHRGMVRHGSYPITTGERHNLVIWLFGRYGYVRFGDYPPKERLTPQERWKQPQRSSKRQSSNTEL